MQFAEEYPTKEDVGAAFKKYGSWYEICQSGLGSRNGKGERHESANREQESGATADGAKADSEQDQEVVSECTRAATGAK